MATHHGKDAVVHVGGTSIGQATGFTVDTNSRCRRRHSIRFINEIICSW